MCGAFFLSDACPPLPAAVVEEQNTTSSLINRDGLNIVIGFVKH